MDMAKKKLVVDITRSTMELDKLKKEHSEVETNNNELLKVLTRAGDSVDVDSAAYKKAEETEEKYFTRIDEIEQAIQAKSKNTVVKKYGLSPVQVNVTLQADAVTGGDQRWFLVEMAPINVMPHSVDFFLGLVEKKFYNGMTLLKQTTGSPTLHTAEIDTNTMQFVDRRRDQLSRLAFPEHSDDYPVQKYSVAFTGPGPMFYINMDTRTQTSVELMDTCFGKVVQGESVMESMVLARNAAHHTNKLSMFGIESIQIIPPKDI
jgi:cyclophilin family peptidyl-prolyl cis-trans isomerase